MEKKNQPVEPSRYDRVYLSPPSLWIRHFIMENTNQVVRLFFYHIWLTKFQKSTGGNPQLVYNNDFVSC